MKGKKIRQSVKAKVIEKKLRDPELSLRDIEKETGTNYVSTKRILDEVPGVVTSCNRGVDILELMDKIVKDVAYITAKQIDKIVKNTETNGEVDTKDMKLLNDIAKNNFDRQQILTGKPTENIRVDFGDLSGKTPKELEEIRRKILGE